MWAQHFVYSILSGFDYRRYKQQFIAAAKARGVDPAQGSPMGNVYLVTNIKADSRGRRAAQATDRGWWKNPDYWDDGDARRLKTGRPTERIAFSWLRYEAKQWIPRVETAPELDDLLETIGVQLVGEILEELHRAARLERPLHELDNQLAGQRINTWLRRGRVPVMLGA